MLIKSTICHFDSPLPRKRKETYIYTRTQINSSLVVTYKGCVGCDLLHLSFKTQVTLLLYSYTWFSGSLLVRIAMSSTCSKSISSSSEDDSELRRGPWTLEEDTLLIHYIAHNGEGRWNLLAKRSGNLREFYASLWLVRFSYLNFNLYTNYILCCFRIEENWQELQIEMVKLSKTRCKAWKS